MVPKIGAKINCLNGPQGFGAQTVLVFVKTLQEIPGEDLADVCELHTAIFRCRLS